MQVQLQQLLHSVATIQGYYDAIKDTYYNSYQKTFQIVPRDIADENIIIESIDDPGV